MTPVAGAAIPKAPLGVVLAPAEEADETTPETDRLALDADRLTPEEADPAEDMVVGLMLVALAAEALRPVFPS